MKQWSTWIIIVCPPTCTSIRLPPALYVISWNYLECSGSWPLVRCHNMIYQFMTDISIICYSYYDIPFTTPRGGRLVPQIFITYFKQESSWLYFPLWRRIYYWILLRPYLCTSYDLHIQIRIFSTRTFLWSATLRYFKYKNTIK